MCQDNYIIDLRLTWACPEARLHAYNYVVLYTDGMTALKTAMRWIKGVPKAWAAPFGLPLLAGPIVELDEDCVEVVETGRSGADVAPLDAVSGGREGIDDDPVGLDPLRVISAQCHRFGVLTYEIPPTVGSQRLPYRS